MKMKQLGHSDIKVSELCLGTMTFGEQNTVEDAFEQLDYAVANGINFIDTAEMYSVPVKPDTYTLTEDIVGRWIAQRKSRDSIVLATKAASADERLTWVRGGPRLNKAHISKAIEGSLQRLNTDYIDLYQLHWPERKTNTFGELDFEYSSDEVATPILESLEAVAELVTAGKVRQIGISNETPWGFMEYLRLAEKHDLPRVVSIQNPYNMLNRTYEVGLSEISIRENVGLMCYGILGSGALSGKYLAGAKPKDGRITLWPEYFGRYMSKGAVTATEKYAKLAQDHGMSLTQMAVAWGLSRPFMLSIILGATKMSQLQEQVSATDIHLSEELQQGILEIHQQHPNPYLLK